MVIELMHYFRVYIEMIHYSEVILPLTEIVQNVIKK